MANWLLDNQFLDHGEQYYKSKGGILIENLPLGIVVIVSHQLFFFLLIFFILFASLNKEIRRIAYRICVVLILLFSAPFLLNYGAKLFQIPEQFERSLEITITWSCRIIGILLAYFAAKVINRSSDKHAFIAD